MKQYKFKCPICGKWHDIFESRSNSYTARCDINPKFGIFTANMPTNPRLLKLLRKLNIEVAEVCGRLRWANNNSQTVFVKSKPNAIRYCAFQFESGVYTPVIQDPDYHKLLIIGKSFTTPKAAKAACQADFEKRRAK